MRNRYRLMAVAVLIAFGAAAAAGVVAAPPHAPAQAQPRSLLSGLPAAALGGPCLRSGRAFLRAHIRGAFRLDVDLHGTGLSCEGGPRLDGSGIRMGFEGRVRPVGRLRMIFGIDGAKEGRSGRELPTNLTVFFGDRKLLFATQGAGNCTVDRLRQEPVGTAHAPTRTPDRVAASRAPSAAAPASPAKTRAYRLVAHGFCIAPVNDLSGRRRIVITSFDFAGRADFNTP